MTQKMPSRLSVRAFSLALASLFACLSAAAQPSGPMDGGERVDVSVHAEHTAVGPDTPVWLGVRFEISEGWHVYWKNPGDTGAEMAVRYRGPDWAAIGELRWPVPRRYVSPGDLLDFVHEGSPVLLTELTIDRDAWLAAGSPESLRFELYCEWFVCKEICLLGDRAVSVEIPVVADGRPADAQPDASNAELFKEARRKLPVPRAEVPEGLIDARFEDGRLRLRVAGASRLTFYPAKSDALALPVDALKEAQKRGSELDIRYRDEASGVEALEGVLVIERAGRDGEEPETMAVEIRVPVDPEIHRDGQESPEKGGSE